MMWRAQFAVRAEEDLAVLDASVRERVLEKIKWFISQGGELRPTPLHGVFGRFAKLRVSDWRIIYSLDFKKQMMTVHYIGHRDKIYKRR